MATIQAEPANVEQAITELFSDAPPLAQTAVKNLVKDTSVLP